MPILNSNDRKRILSITMDFIKKNCNQLLDDFPIDLTERYFEYISENKSTPNLDSFLKIAKDIKTNFFLLNRKIPKREFYSELLEELNSVIKPRLDIEKHEIIGTTECLYEQIYIDDIDTFSKVKKIKPHEVRNIVPLNIPEDTIKEAIADIIGEPFIPKHSPAEKSDLYSNHIELRGKRIDTAFMLKGPSVKKLTLDKAGSKGTQILKLTKEPANLFIVQSTGQIDTYVIEHLQSEVFRESEKRGHKLYYCIIDGTDTARLLKAYDKL